MTSRRRNPTKKGTTTKQKKINTDSKTVAHKAKRDAKHLRTGTGRSDYIFGLWRQNTFTHTGTQKQERAGSLKKGISYSRQYLTWQKAVRYMLYKDRNDSHTQPSILYGQKTEGDRLYKEGNITQLNVLCTPISWKRQALWEKEDQTAIWSLLMKQHIETGFKKVLLCQ